jgi:AsmA protein
MMRKTSAGAGLVAVLLMGSAIAFAAAPDFAIAQLEAYVADRTSRSLAVTGGAHVEFSPSLAIRLDGVSLSNPQGMEGRFLTARSLRLPITFAELMQRQLPVNQVTLSGANFNFLIDARGRANWTESGKGGPNPSPLSIVLEEAQLAFLDQRHGQAFGLTGIDAAADLTETGELTARGSATISGQRVKFDSYLKSPARAAGEGSPATVSIESPLVKIGFDGRLAAETQIGLAGQVTASAPDMRAAARLFGMAPGGTLGFRNLALAGNLDSEGSEFKLRTLRIGFDGFKGEGVAIVDFATSLPSIAFSLDSESLDLNPYLPSKRPVASELAEGAAAWETAPLGFAALRGLDIKLQLKTGKLVYGAVETGAAAIEAALADGRLNARISTTAFYGGKADIQAIVDGSVTGPAMELTITAQDVEARDLLRDFAGLDRIEGNASLTAVLKGSGGNQQQMISTLAGPAAIRIAGGTIRGVDAVSTLDSVRAGPVAGWPFRNEDAAPFEIMSVTAALTDGVATLSELKLDGSSLLLEGKGDIDLLRRDLDLAIEARPADAEQPVIFMIKGPWARPQIALASQSKGTAAKPRIIREIGEAVDTVKTSRPVQSVKRGTRKIYRKLFGN